MKNKLIEAKRRKEKMKKVTLGVMVFSLIALLGVSFVSAFSFGFTKGPMSQDLTDEELLERQTFHEDILEAIKNSDFDAWKNLMQSQLTEENFNKIVEMHNNNEEFAFGRGQYSKDGDCPMLNGDGENFQRGMRMHAPLTSN